MAAYWRFATPKGAFVILPRANYFVLLFETEELENHASAPEAALAAAQGTCRWPSCGDPAKLGLPDNLAGWTRVPVI